MKYGGRKRGSLPLAGMPVLQKVVAIHANRMVIQIEFPNQRAGPAEYVENLRRFFQKSPTALPSIEALGFHGYPPTATPSVWKWDVAMVYFRRRMMIVLWTRQTTPPKPTLHLHTMGQECHVRKRSSCQ